MFGSLGVILMKASAGKHTPAMVSVLGIATIPLLFSLPAWITLWCFSLWGYAVAAHVRRWPWPGRRIRLGLTIIGCILVFSFLGGGRMGGNTFVGLLAVMAGLKPFENRHHRDRMVSLFLVYFTIISSLFVIENLLITLYMFFSVFIATACLIYFNHPNRPPREGFRLAAVIMGQAIPVMIVLFLFFPRLEGTFFGFRGSGQGRTGFSESIAPGSISNLVKDNKTAFRAEFDGDLPLAEELYWRGLVLWDFDGSTWKKGSTASRIKRPVGGKRSFEYHISMEAHQRRHLVALDLPVTAPAYTRLMEDYTLFRNRPLSRGLRYTVRSYTDAAADSLPRRVDRALRLPDDGNAKSRALAGLWREQNDSQERIIDQALAYFESNNFQYTLNPPLMLKDSVDAFLFESRRGYCEHYASAFAFLMRAAGIPARVVAGYLGGERNPYGNYLIVRQYHAHAWTEVFLKGSGWVRIDPTAVVVPERVSMGLAESLMANELPAFLTRTKLGRLSLYWEKAGFMWDAAGLRWNAWLMEYSRQEQVGLWGQLKESVRLHQNRILAGSVLLAVISAGVFLYRHRRIQPKFGKDPVLAAYRLFCKKLEGIGIKKEPSQGPLEFARQVGMLRSDLKKPVNEIIQCYIGLRYAESRHEDSANILIKKVRKFHPLSKKSLSFSAG
jgi:transglutaminase-like putative cysteine protease